MPTRQYKKQLWYLIILIILILGLIFYLNLNKYPESIDFSLRIKNLDNLYQIINKLLTENKIQESNSLFDICQILKEDGSTNIFFWEDITLPINNYLKAKSQFPLPSDASYFDFDKLCEYRIYWGKPNNWFIKEIIHGVHGKYLLSIDQSGNIFKSIKIESHE